jgi:hypothetical protein
MASPLSDRVPSLLRGFACTLLALCSALTPAWPGAAQTAPTPADAAHEPPAEAAPEADADETSSPERGDEALSRAGARALEARASEAKMQAPRRELSAHVALEREDEAYDQVLTTYRTARRLFGEDHVVLTAIALTGGRCKAEDTLWKCKNKLDYDTGIAGLVAVPLVGWGASWGWDWFPVLQTEGEAQAYERFTRHARAYQQVAQKVTDMAPADTEQLELAFQRSLELLRQTLVQALEDDKRYFKEAAAMLGCLQRLRSSADPLKRRQAQLDAMWNEYELLAGDLPQRRHGFLLGPAAAIQVNEPFDYLYGISAEFGRPWARLMVTGGLRGSTSNIAFRPVGWYVGLGLSGELADDLVNLITGATNVASKL